jgi:hypothetical protein
MRSILVSYQYEIYRTTVREKCSVPMYHITMSVLSVKYDIVFVMPINGAIRIKIPPFDSAQKIVLKDVKCITKHQYSSDLWPLKIKRNCIVDKSRARSTFVLVFVLPN